MRIVSLLPSATEMICGIGLGKQLCGVTHECDYPAEITADLPKVTTSSIPHDATSSEIDRLVSERVASEGASTQLTLYSLKMDVLERLCPDVIVTQTLCDVCAVAEADVITAVTLLPGVPQVINLSPTNLGDVLAQMRELGQRLQCDIEASDAVNQLQARIDAVGRRSESMDHRPSVVLLEWLDPPFSAGHWNPALVQIAGGVELLGQEGGKSRRINWKEILDVDPEVMVIACCGFSLDRAMLDVPTLKARPSFESLRCVRNQRVYIVDGSSYFNRPGPRLVDSLEMLAHLIDPTVHPRPCFDFSTFRL